MKKWFVAAKKADFEAIGKKFHITPMTARIIRNRDVIGDEQIRKYLYGDTKDLYSPWLLKGMKEAVALLQKSIDAGERIRVIGDYDIDGVCSTYILLTGLKKVGANVDTVIPDRIKDGYGINEQLIDQASEDGIQTIITCTGLEEFVNNRFEINKVFKVSGGEVVIPEKVEREEI